MTGAYAGILTELLGYLVGGVTTLGEGIASGINATVTALFVSGAGESIALSIFGAMIGIFGGIALAVGLTTKIVSWLGSLGGRSM